jgi:hypothetical protein
LAADDRALTYPPFSSKAEGRPVPDYIRHDDFRLAPSATPLYLVAALAPAAI